MKLRHRAGLGDALLEDLAVGRLGVRQQQVVVDRLVLLALRGVDLQLAEQRVHAERAGLVGDDRHDALAELRRRGTRLRSRRVKRHGGATRPGRPSPRSSSVNGASAGSGERLRRPCVARLGSEPSRARRRSIMYWYSSESSAGRKYGGHVAVERRRRGSRRAGTAGRAAPAAGRLVIFLIWWVALRPSTPGPSVQPLTVLARMTVGAPDAEVLGGGLVGGVELAVVVAAAGQVAQVVVGEVLAPSGAAAGRDRRSARGCRRPTRPRSAGTRRRRWCSSC